MNRNSFHHWLFLSIFPGLLFFVPSGCKSYKREKSATTNSTASPSRESRQDQVRDVDGNVYRAVSIGKQVWLGENLRVKHFQNGEPIPNIMPKPQWRSLKSAALCHLDNDSSNTVISGCLYNWYAAEDKRNICPKGWHVPSDEEWFQLTGFLGGEVVAGGKLKEQGTVHWSAPNTGATNETGFSALPVGYRSNTGSYYWLDTYSFYWTSTSYSESFAFCRFLQNDSEELNRIENSNTFGFSVRCIKND